MAILKLNSQIVNDEEKAFLEWNGVSGTSFDDIKSFIAAIPADDPEIDIRINCAGGDCVEGWAIYDALRQSGKTIKATIEGECSSMATAILLAAPSENRMAYQNAHICIHNPFVCGLNVDMYATLTADNIDAMAVQLQNQAAMIRDEQNKILNLYVERTGTDAETLQALMDQNIFINMNRAKELGFVSTILAPITAHKKSNLINMNKKIKDAFVAFANAIGINGVKLADLTITTPTGEELVVEREEGEPQVGDAASPDGEFVLEDGTKIVVANGVITDIVKPDENNDPEPANEPEPTAKALVDPNTGEEINDEDAQNLINEQNARIAELEAEIAELKKEKEENAEIVDKVNQNGGAAWLENIMKMQSGNFHPKNNNGVGDAKIGGGFLASSKNPVFRR